MSEPVSPNGGRAGAAPVCSRRGECCRHSPGWFGPGEAEQAAAYLGLADAILGPAWADAGHFRIGASALLGELRKALAA